MKVGKWHDLVCIECTGGTTSGFGGLVRRRLQSRRDKMAFWTTAMVIELGDKMMVYSYILERKLTKI